MPAYLPSPSIELSLRSHQESVHERRDRYRGKLNIATPTVPEELRKRWYGMPPSKCNTKRLGDTLTF